MDELEFTYEGRIYRRKVALRTPTLCLVRFEDNVPAEEGMLLVANFHDNGRWHGVKHFPAVCWEMCEALMYLAKEAEQCQR